MLNKIIQILSQFAPDIDPGYQLFMPVSSYPRHTSRISGVRRIQRAALKRRNQLRSKGARCH